MSRQYRNGGVTAALGRPPIAYAEGRCVGGGHRGQQRALPPPSAELVEEWRRDGVAISPTSTRTSPMPAARHRARALRLGAARAGPRGLRRPRAAARGRSGWAVAEVPRWYHDYAGGRARPPTPDDDADLPAARGRAGAAGRGPAGGDRLRSTGARAPARPARRRRPEPSTVARRARSVVLRRRGAAAGAAAAQRRARPVGRHAEAAPHRRSSSPASRAMSAAEDVPVHQVKEFAPDLSFGGSASRPGQVALALADDWAARPGRPRRSPTALAVYYAAIRRRGRARVLAVPGCGTRSSLIASTAPTWPAARRGLRPGWRSCCCAPAPTPSTPSAAAPGACALPPRSRGRTRRCAPRRTLMTVHLCSPCPWARTRPQRRPTRSGGCGLDGVWVNDASLLPDAPGLNPQGTIMAIADRNCEHLLAGIGRSVSVGEPSWSVAAVPLPATGRASAPTQPVRVTQWVKNGFVLRRCSSPKQFERQPRRSARSWPRCSSSASSQRGLLLQRHARPRGATRCIRRSGTAPWPAGMLGPAAAPRCGRGAARGRGRCAGRPSSTGRRQCR